MILAIYLNIRAFYNLALKTLLLPRLYDLPMNLVVLFSYTVAQTHLTVNVLPRPITLHPEITTSPRCFMISMILSSTTASISPYTGKLGEASKTQIVVLPIVDSNMSSYLIDWKKP